MQKQECACIPIKEAAQIIGIPPGRIRGLMKRDYLKKTNTLPIGRVVPSGGSGKRLSYRIYRPMVMKYIGEREEGE